jgi:hypothetical protein
MQWYVFLQSQLPNTTLRLKYYLKLYSCFRKRSRRSQEDLSSDEKREKFLERNRSVLWMLSLNIFCIPCPKYWSANSGCQYFSNPWPKYVLDTVNNLELVFRSRTIELRNYYTKLLLACLSIGPVVPWEVTFQWGMRACGGGWIKIAEFTYSCTINCSNLRIRISACRESEFLRAYISWCRACSKTNNYFTIRLVR